jgi:hypothetical protein
VLLANARAGSHLECRSADGSTSCVYAYNDRGLGEAKVARYVLDSAGLPTALQIDGNDYLRAPVKERFAVAGRQAEWASKGEHGQTPYLGQAYYVALDGLPADRALLARALDANGGRLALLPVGEARGERVLARTVEAGGRSMEVALHAVSGLDFTPTLVWLDAENTLFGILGGWLQVVREGWEPVVSQLVKAQEEWEAKRSRERVGRLARRPGHVVAITRTRVFDAEADVMRSPWTVVFEGERILAVGPDSQIEIPPAAERIDGAGKTLLPGLCDMHVHLEGKDGLLHLACGVTSVRDLANEKRILDEIERRVASGEALGPRVIRAGFIDGRGPHQGPVQAFATNADSPSPRCRSSCRVGSCCT